jgi:predicted aspartyl protease
MKLELRHNLPFTSASLSHQGKSIDIKAILIDTGSSSTVMSADLVEAIGIVPRPDDILNKLRGIGGTEVVYSRVVDRLAVGDAYLSDFDIEIGGMDYGFEIYGIIGMDFLRRTGSVINLRDMTLEFMPGKP